MTQKYQNIIYGKYNDYNPDTNRYKYHWNEIFREIVKELKKVEKEGIKDSMRELNYALIAINVLPNLHKCYQSLTQHVTTWRENGDLHIDCLIDERHPVTNIDDNYYSPDTWIRHYIDKLRNIADWYHKNDTNFPKWLGQKNYVEIWIEKQAARPRFEKIVKDENLQVRIQPFGGWAAFVTLTKSVDRLKEKMKEGKDIHVLYFGDYDPSGEDMDRDIEARFRRIGVWEIEQYEQDYSVKLHLHRIAVTKEQIHHYNLPWDAKRLTEDEQEKLQHDSRYEKFVEKNGGEAYATELEALSKLYPEEFKKIVSDSVNQYFSNDLYLNGLKKHRETYTYGYINNTRNTLVKEFSKGLV
jgi:hypothetical protein